MRIQLVSDLHLDFHRDRGKSFIASLPVLADTLVVAGDLAELRKEQDAREWLGPLCKKWRNVVYVSGNHDYYGATPAQIDELRASMNARYTNLHWLENESVTIDGQRFLGCTLWFRDRPDNVLKRRYVADFSAIHGFDPWVYKRNRESVAFIDRNLTSDDVLVTHHIPHRFGICPDYAGSDTNRFFYCAIDEQLETVAPRAALFGHTHWGCNMQLPGGTTLACNPSGYPSERTNFNPGLVIEV